MESLSTCVLNTLRLLRNEIIKNSCKGGIILDTNEKPKFELKKYGVWNIKRKHSGEILDAVFASDQLNAYQKAKEKWGENITIERTMTL